MRTQNDKPMKLVGCAMPLDMIERAKTLARHRSIVERRDVSMSEIIRRGLEKLLDAENAEVA